MGRAVQTAIDSLNFFVESRNVGNIANVVTTATGTFISADQVNTAQKGAMFFVAFASVTVNTVSVNFSILAKDVSASVYFPYITQAIGVTPTTVNSTIMLYVGAVSGTFSDPSVSLITLPLPNVYQVVVSLSVATTASMSGTVSYKIDSSKLM
jgi:hypothetical protein